MSDIQENAKGGIAWAKKHWLILAVGVFGIWIVMRYSRASSAPASNSGTDYAGLAAMQSAGLAASAQSASQNLAVQTESDQASIERAKIDATLKVASMQAEIGQTTAIGQNILNIGSTIAASIAAESALPAAAINAAAVTNQTALAGSAAVAAQGVQSLPDALQGAAHLLGVQTGNFGTTLIGFGSNLADETGNALNAIASNSGPAVNAAAASASNSANANSRTAVEGEKAAAQIFGGMLI